MAISIDSTTNLNLIDAAEATTGWSFSGMTKTATSSSSREGTNCIGGQVADNAFGYAYHTHGSAIDLTAAGNERVYIWARNAGAGTLAQKGWLVWIGDGTHARAYTVGGSDAEPFGAKGWYCLMLDTANLPTSYNQVVGSNEPDLTAITQFGFGTYNTVAPSGNALNVFVDVVRYGSGIIVTSGASDEISLADIAAEDFSSATGKAYGVIREIQPGVYGIQGDILFGDTGGSSIDWKEADAVVIFEDRVQGAGTNTKYQMSGQHSATGTFSAELGIAVSSGDDESGRSGVTFVSANPADQPIDFDFSDSDIEDIFLYGCTFTNMRGGTIAFSADATNGISHHISGSTFSGCSQIDPGQTVVRNCTFAATADSASSLIWSADIDIKKSQFLGNTTGAAIEHPDCSDVFTHDALTFSGNTYDVENSDNASTINAGSFVVGRAYKILTVGTTDFTAIGSDDNVVGTKFIATGIGTGTGTATEVLLINATNGANTSQAKVNNSGTNADALVQNAINLAVTVLDDSTGLAISNARVHLLKDSDKTVLMSKECNASGIATVSINYDADTDVVGWARQFDVSGTDYVQKDFSGQYTSNGFSATVRLQPI